MIYEYRGARYPDYLKRGNACQFIAPAALTFCKGKGLDIGAGKWPLPGAIAVDLANGGDAMRLPEGKFDYIFSSHCLEHLPNPVAALEHWKTRLKAPSGVLFLYLPHPDMEYWLPQHNRKHLHAWQPREMERIIRDLGFVNTVRSERDFAWSFAVAGFMPPPASEDDQAIPGPSALSTAPDAAFRWLIETSSEHVHADPQLAAIFKRFGADAFRRSAGVEPEFETIIKRCGFRGKRCVEIGTYNGITALILARYFDEVVSIDIFPHTIKHTLADFCGVKNIRFIDVKDNAEKAKIIGELQFDAAYVDGDHQNDADSDLDCVRRCGRVLFHEYWGQQPPVWNLVNSLRATGSVQVEGKFALWTARGHG